MVDGGSALALMGNHEFNALCFHTRNADGEHLRTHSYKNRKQHRETLLQFEAHRKEWEEAIAWFMTLPLYYEAEGFRAVHACWHEEAIALLKNTLVNARLTESLLHQSVNRGTSLYKAIDVTIKGKEFHLPAGIFFRDKDDINRKVMRVKWWENVRFCTYRTYSVEPLAQLPDEPVDYSKVKNTTWYNEQEKPVFFGHYCLRSPIELFRNNICCLDYCVTKHGQLTAYRYDGEDVLSNEKWITSAM
jgi:hypothetical protein